MALSVVEGLHKPHRGGFLNKSEARLERVFLEDLLWLKLEIKNNNLLQSMPKN